MTTVFALSDNQYAVATSNLELLSMPVTAPKGLQDVVANESSICFIDGARGILSYRGIDIHELA